MTTSTSDYQQYWGTVVDTLAYIYLYKMVATDELEYQIRSEFFPEAINRSRREYYNCDQFPYIPFGMVGDEIDEFFHEMIMHPEYLDAIYDEAFELFKLAFPAYPLRLMLEEVKKTIG